MSRSGPYGLGHKDKLKYLRTAKEAASRYLAGTIEELKERREGDTPFHCLSEKSICARFIAQIEADSGAHTFTDVFGEVTKVAASCQRGSGFRCGDFGYGLKGPL